MRSDHRAAARYRGHHGKAGPAVVGARMTMIDTLKLALRDAIWPYPIGGGIAGLALGMAIGYALSVPDPAEQQACREAVAAVMSTKDPLELDRAKFLVEHIRGCRVRP